MALVGPWSSGKTPHSHCGDGSSILPGSTKAIGTLLRREFPDFVYKIEDPRYFCKSKIYEISGRFSPGPPKLNNIDKSSEFESR